MTEWAAKVLENVPDYDAGLLNDWGGGNVHWWQDYLRAEIGRANEAWRENALAAIARMGAGDDMVERLLENDREIFLPLLGEAAARIAALTAQNREMALDVLASSGQAQEAYAAQLDAEAEAAALRAKVARLEGDAEWQDEQRRDAFARRHLSAPEDPHVYVLCERYGYGAVMDAASRLWARNDSMGAFYIGGCIGIKPTAALTETLADGGSNG